jgi:excinuclease UvrABC nuclease subunit
MYKLRFAPPYKKNGKTAFPEATRPGVYLIKENGKLVYIGMSQSNVYKALYRHFQTWNDRRSERVTYVDRMNRLDYTVRIVYATPAQAARLEMALIIKHKPRDNENKYKDYSLDMRDKKALNEYESIETTPINEVPF